ncbi:hypothetical protein T484DRAFT_1835314 [Baffinella frigidus]|nr:hypothetical protein T484DRAFT_1835314 [Cryptophyta sp. CCMP2293]
MAGGVLDGKYMGEGVFSWNNGQVFSGQWVGGRRESQNPFEVFSGQWVGGLREGTGTEIFPPHDNTKVDEEGELTFPYYEGNLLEGKRSGKGLYTFANGDKYQVSS